MGERNKDVREIYRAGASPMRPDRREPETQGCGLIWSQDL